MQRASYYWVRSLHSKLEPQARRTACLSAPDVHSVEEGLSVKGKNRFTSSEADQIKQLLREKSAASPEKQKGIRQKQRNLGFYLSDYPNDDFDQLVRAGHISIIDDEVTTAPPAVDKIRDCSDESYVIGLCDRAIGVRASRHHTFEFLRGDPGPHAQGRPLPVDAYYAELKLVVEYCERQHTEDVRFFNRRMTVSGVNRGEQRASYDQRRRDVLPQHGIRLIELHYTDFRHTSNKRLVRDRDADLQIIRRKLSDAGLPVV